MAVQEFPDPLSPNVMVLASRLAQQSTIRSAPRVSIPVVLTKLASVLPAIVCAMRAQDNSAPHGTNDEPQEPMWFALSITHI